ncbi:MAG TPA: B12-binding domain-containing radical SAM protein [Candidatus Bathyarchaeia archaeon]|nr:B12-binding domain-containing radical SAM protein [Candidatus Bathyarchaeia archaeon]
MNVLFLNLPNPPGLYVNRDYCGGFGSAFPIRRGDNYTVFPPIFDAYAAAVLENEGYKVSMIDAQAADTAEPQLLESVENGNPELIVSRISLPSFESDLKTIGSLKARLSKVFYAGWGSVCKVEPQATLSKGSLDAVIRDELEFVISSLTKAIKNGTDLDEVAGISFKKSGKIVDNPSRPYEMNLDKLPTPAYHLLNMKAYRASESYFFSGGSKNRSINFFTLLSSRGCNFNCLYCPYPTIFGPWRATSPEKVVGEMESLVKDHGVRVFWFHDQVFTMIPKRTEKICDEIIKAGLDVKWACETHVKRLPGQLVRKMKRAGCTRVQVGIETGDPQLLANVGKKGCTIQEVEEAIRQLHGEGILVEANFMVGLPGENWDTIAATAKLIRNTKPDDVAISMITPYPGTPLFALAKEKNLVITEDWSRYTTGQPIIAFPSFSGEDMREAQRYLYGVFMYRRRLAELKETLKERRIQKLAGKLKDDMTEIGVGAFIITRHGIRTKLLSKRKSREVQA